MVLVQNQHGPKAKQWGCSGVVVEISGGGTYLVKIDGSGRVSLRRRQYLKPINKFNPETVGLQVAEGVDEVGIRRSKRLEGRGA